MIESINNNDKQGLTANAHGELVSSVYSVHFLC